MDIVVVFTMLNNGTTALDFARRNGYTPIMDTLRNHGALEDYNY